MATTSARTDGPAPIVVYGATGYTGRLISGELSRRGARLTIAGRSREKLDAVAARLPAEAEIAAVRLDDERALRELVAGARGGKRLRGRSPARGPRSRVRRTGTH